MRLVAMTSSFFYGKMYVEGYSMKNDKYDLYVKKIDKIKKHLKKDKLYLELQLLNYEGYYLYIIINYIKKIDSYKLIWFDLEDLEDNKIDKYFSCEYIPNELINRINEKFEKYIVSSKYNESMESKEDVVKLKAYIKTKEDDSIDVSFHKFLPKSLAHLSDLFIMVFNNLPRKLENFLFELLAKLTDSTTKYEYKKEFYFDLFKDDIDSIFAYQIRERGKKYYEDKTISYLEKIEDRYFAIVEDTEKYLVIIKYKKKKKIMQVYCSCPCEFYCKHIYAVILAVRNNEFNRFYKIMYKNPNESLLERIMSFDYFLCTGVIEQNLEIINNYGEIELVPILDINNKCNWEVLEDSEDEKLLKQINEFLHER